MEEKENSHQLIDRLRAHGWRMTAQRRVIVEALSGTHVHLTADDAYQITRKTLPEISLATIYNTLNELVNAGEVIEIMGLDGRHRYDPNIYRKHHHIVCVDCNCMMDVYIDREPALKKMNRHGFEILGADIIFKGICSDCSAESPSQKSGSSNLNPALD